ncbi:hypothetical protein EYF80_060830 [Liparis tanakae]|uniref:Uncharacterized protein n=1 Tax=Liparis tanakae TaxID=230148 RepID=A0A4Z2EKC6_9TELE|nr:hypothetical protein EYF80_060830 [Liparis tanakae]
MAVWCNDYGHFAPRDSCSARPRLCSTSRGAIPDRARVTGARHRRASPRVSPQLLSSPTDRFQVSRVPMFPLWVFM